jgi:hypothetical protein
MVDYSFWELDDTENLLVVSQRAEKLCLRQRKCDPMNKDEFKKFYREHLAVPVAGFGMAAVLLAIFLLLMTWLSGQVHLMQYSLDRFSH